MHDGHQVSLKAPLEHVVLSELKMNALNTVYLSINTWRNINSVMSMSSPIDFKGGPSDLGTKILQKY